MIADELRRQADHFIELSSLAETIGRPQQDRPPRRERKDDDEFEDDFDDGADGEDFADR